MSSDSLELRELLCKLLPGLLIESVASPSGQRVVYFAKFRHPAPEQRIKWGNVVTKVSEQLSPRQIAYLEKEIHLLNTLCSSYYPKLLYSEAFTRDPDTGENLPHRIFVSIEEQLAAKPLTECKKRFRNEGQVISLLLELIEGLNLLWSRPERVVHRDLKPANILIRDDGSVAIIDLGIVREEGTPGLTEDAAQWGPCTPPYASPEQARNDKKSISFKSDLFSLGTIAYELLTGTNPYVNPQSDSREDVLRKIQTYIPASLNSIGKSSPAFSRVVENLMKKEPFERFRTISRLKQELQECREPSNGK
jgi:eukaryotic-like serine/threonine-protein kinase